MADSWGLLRNMLQAGYLVGLDMERDVKARRKAGYAQLRINHPVGFPPRSA